MTGNESVELYDIYGVWHVPFWQTMPFLISVWTVIGIILCALIYALIRFMIKRKKPLKPWVWADRELDALWEHRGFTREDGKRFYSQLTEIIKQYLEKRYGYQVRSATDIELLTYLRDHHFDPELCNELTRIFEGMQEIKFANLDAIPENIERDFVLSKAFVAKTIAQNE